LRGSALHISPPFVITPQQIEAIVEGLRRALDAATERRLAAD
jgi:adenosylmethionine-8-amino-7-oxononanoate aminotransferase